MKQIQVAAVLGMVLIVSTLAPAAARAAQDDADNRPRRAYKPAERREQARQAAAEAEAAQAAGREASAADDVTVPPGVADPEGYKRDVLAARSRRDKDLKAAEKETDRRKFEKRKEQIFAQYATILAEMREKYVAQQGDKAVPTRQAKGSKKNARTPVPERYSRPETKRKAARPDDEPNIPDDAPPAKTTARSNKRKGAKDDAGDSLTEARRRLDDETKRHETEMEQLNKQLAAAESSSNRREVRKAQRAIDKENTTYDAKKTLLERRVKELGGTVGSAKDTAKGDVR